MKKKIKLAKGAHCFVLVMYFLARLLIRSSAICFQCALLHIIIIFFFLFVCACSMYYKTVHVCTILYVHERLFRCIDNLALFRTHADIKTHAPLFSLLLPIYIYKYHFLCLNFYADSKPFLFGCVMSILEEH